MTQEFFTSKVHPIIKARFRASAWARQSDTVRSGHYARWYISLLDKYSNHKASFDEIDDAVSSIYSDNNGNNPYGPIGYFMALTRTPYYKYKIIHTKARRCQ